MTPGFHLALPPGPVLILGGSSTLGMALGGALQRAGLPVALAVRNEAGAERVRAVLPQAAILWLDGESTDPARSPATLCQRCETALGAPVRHMADLMHSRYESLLAGGAPDDISRWATNDIGLRALLLRDMARTMLAQRAGRCIFVSSTAADRPAPGQAFYAAAKLAGEALYTSLGLELGARGITTCSLRLGWLDAGRGTNFLATRLPAHAHPEQRPRHGKATAPPATSADFTQPSGENAPGATTSEAAPSGLAIPSGQGRATSAIPLGRTTSLHEAVQALLYLFSVPAVAHNATVLTMDGGFSALKPTL